MAEEPDEIIAEPDLENQNPAFLVEWYQTGVGFLQAYGWYLLLSVVVLLFIKSKLDKPLQKWRKKKEEDAEYHHYDADEAHRKQEAMDAARRRLQEKYDAQAELHAEEQKRKEEEKRKAKIEDWDRHQKGGGYRSKTRVTEEDASTSSMAKPKKKNVYRSNDYNPLIGDTGGACFRPARGSAGGGG